MNGGMRQDISIVVLIGKNKLADFWAPSAKGLQNLELQELLGPDL